MGWGIFMVPFIQDHYFIRLAVLAFFAAFLLSIWFRTGYYLTGQTLTIYYGPFKKKINVKEIRSICFVKIPFIAPALSTQQIQIKYSKRKTIRISPRDPEVFVQFLKVRATFAIKA
ncbi:PH domain-containing protein [Priestia flexa]|nr:PH domain-containing protein [Priestia flexa]